MADKNMNAKINVDFEESTSRQSLNSGDSLPTLFGKIKKYFSDLKTVCFSGSYNDLSDKPTTATTETDGLMSAEDKTKLDNADNTYALKSKYGDSTINVGRKAETTVGKYSTAEGNNTTASGWTSHAEGDGTIASGDYSHAEGKLTTASGYASHTEGNATTASSDYSHAEGKSTAASGLYSHAEGRGTTASGNNSHAEGATTAASNYAAHAEGNETTASGTASHAEGQSTTASGNNSHAEGNNTTASGNCSHAEGYSSDKVTQLITDFLNGNITKDDIINTWNTKKFSVAHGNESHVEGQDNLSLGHYSHSEGCYTVASGNYSHTSGYYTKALHDNEAAYGKYNESNDNTLFSVGDGTADNARHNAFEITATGGKLHDKDIATTDLIPTSLPANGGNADSADTLTDWGTRTVTNANDAPFGFCAALDCENAPNTFWSTILTTGSSRATSYKTQIAFPWAFGVGENRIRYRCENNGEWGSWQEISTTPIKSEVMSVSTDSSGNSVIFDAVENKKIISINCFAKQAVPFNYNNKQYGHFTENDGSPYVGSASFTVYYIEG